METRLIRTGELRNSAELPERTYEFVISNESVDRHGTIVKADGLDLSDYKRNPVVAYNHLTWTSDPDTIIGTSEVRQEGSETIAVLTLEEGNPLADKVARKLANGTLRAASIGFQAQEGRWGDETRGEDPNVFVFTKASLHEWSVVSVPSNKDALKRNAEAIEDFKASVPKPVEERKGMSLRTKETFRKGTKFNKNEE